VEFSYILKSAGLVALKTQRFFHAKPFPRRLKSSLQVSELRVPILESAFTSAHELVVVDADHNVAVPSLSDLADWVMDHLGNNNNNNNNGVKTDLALYVTSSGRPESALRVIKPVEYCWPSDPLPGCDHVVRVVVPNVRRDKLVCVQEVVQMLLHACSQQWASLTLVIPFFAMPFALPYCDLIGNWDGATTPLQPTLPPSFVILITRCPSQPLLPPLRFH
jgi:hypothetical protein